MVAHLQPQVRLPAQWGAVESRVTRLGLAFTRPRAPADCAPRHPRRETLRGFTRASFHPRTLAAGD